jgi:hypothetical protein
MAEPPADRLDDRRQHHPEPWRPVAAARECLRSGRGVRLKDPPSRRAVRIAMAHRRAGRDWMRA